MDPLYVFPLVLLCIFFLVCLGLWFYYWAPKFRFWLTFGMWPSREQIKRNMCQEQVERTLPHLAIPFLLVCADEQKMAEMYFPYSAEKENRNPKKDRKELEGIQRKLARKKKIFFDARDLARRFDLEVCDDAQQYVSVEDRKRFNVNSAVTTVEQTVKA